MCKECGSTEVQTEAWVYMNTGKLADYFDEATNYCDTCEKNVDVEYK